jgi:hypothetical protein
MALIREDIDGVSGEEIIVKFDKVRLMTLESLDYTAKQDKKMLYGCGKTEAFGRARGPKKYDLSFTVKAVNRALLHDDDEGGGSGTKFKIGDDEYTDLLDIRGMTIQVIYPSRNEGEKIVREFKGVEFNEDKGAIKLEEAEGRTLTAEAISASGLI